MLFKLLENLVILAVAFQLVPGSWTGILDKRDFSQESVLEQIFWQGTLENPTEVSVALAVAGPEKVNEESLGVRITGTNALVADLRSGKILFSKEADEARPIASMTKLMTVLVFLSSEPKWDAVTEVGGCGNFKAGQFKVKDLFYATLVASDNCAAQELAESMSSTTEDFVALMNQRAASLGLAKAHFVEPTGLDPENKATAVEVAKILKQAMQYPEMRDATTRSFYEFRSLSGDHYFVKNTDDLLASFVNKPPYRILAGKTGSLAAAGYCLALAVEKDGGEVMAIVFNSRDDATRFQDVKSLVYWAFKNFKWPENHD
jgi:D-alanyl-D-alanine carboxypeptidase